VKKEEQFFGLSKDNLVSFFFKMPLVDIFWGITLTGFVFCCWGVDWFLIQLGIKEEKPFIN